ncbi:uncharacterized protein LOC119768907 [Culex quinquefasciatus]|uniref:uncharacterized protein LOC119768907 n=1 Tax=Culex quinquefasciatus TaxID=7176 RepID=UPI0018E3DB6D|nr:uncharacterized protein LOC119768907 [Culex quinquefasciatus]
MVFLRRLRSKYGWRAEMAQRTLVKMQVKLAKLKNRKVFLLNCRRLKLTPSFLNFAVHINLENDKPALKANKLVSRFKQQLLSVLISDSIISINKTNRSADASREQLERTIEPIDLEDCLQFATTKQDHTFTRYKSRQQRKLEKLRSSRDVQNATRENWVVNCTNEVLPEYVTRSLQLGSGFNNPNPHTAPYVRVLSEIEAAVNERPNADLIRQDVSNAIINHVNYTKQSFHDEHESTRKKSKTKQFLLERGDLVVTKADKGKTVVVMKREEYDEKMQALVSDVETYEQIARTRPRRHAKQSEVKVYKLHNCNPPRVYGLPKTHKDGRPLRIINSTIGTATYKMAQYLSNILNQVAGKTEHHIVNSFEFVEEIPVSNIVLERIERAALENLMARGIVPVFFKRYVDDCLLCARLEDVEIVLEVFNSFHQRLQFTMEMEVDMKLKFLDVILRRRGM